MLYILYFIYVYIIFIFSYIYIYNELYHVKYVLSP